MDKQVIDSLLQGRNTNTPGDSMVHAGLLALLRASGNHEGLAYAQQLIMTKRHDWVNCLVRNQRHWQNTRSVNVHHDSFELREKYIAPHMGYSEERAFEIKARAYNRQRRP